MLFRSHMRDRLPIFSNDRVSAGASVDGAFRADAVQEIEVVAGRRARVDLRVE